jgi:hypothetical protein
MSAEKLIRQSKDLIWASLTVLLLSAWRLHADSESGNWPFVAAATTDGTTWHGGYYAKCIPGKLFGTNGVTRVYRVEKERDVLVHTYDWYSAHIYVSGANRKVSVVRFGPWSRGHRASSNDLALALYYDGKLLRSYSTLDIAGRTDNVQSSVSHYGWYKRVIGYGHNASPPSVNLTYGFSIETLDSRTLCFDVTTGELLKNARRVRSISTSSSSTNVVIEYEE